MKQHHSSVPRKTVALSIPLLILSLLFLIRPASAQTQFTGWLATFQNYKLNDKIGLYFDGQVRSTGQLQQVQSILLRPGLNIYFAPTLTGTIGYAYIPQQRVSGGVTGYLPEHRSWQQLLYTHPLHHRTTLAHRLRLEQRFLPQHHAAGNSLVHDGHHYAGRLRYFTRSVIPLGHTHTPAIKDLAKASGKTPGFRQGWFAAAQNELFVNLGDPSSVNGKFFDQNRAYMALGYRFNRGFDTEIGYMNQYINGTGTNSTNNHILQVATYLRL